MDFVKLIHTDIDHERLARDLFDVISKFNLTEYSQISVTSMEGNDDWECGNGKISKLKYPERYFRVINNSIKDSYISECVKRYSDFYRWRILKLKPKYSYSIHSDGNGVHNNLRLHIPIITNKESFLAFYDILPNHKETARVYFEHLEVGNSYIVDTTNLHTAVNYGTTDRYHLVGVKYENSNNWSH